MNVHADSVRLKAQALDARARATLRSVFGYDDFRPGQAEVITAVLAGEDVLAVLPTGSGKSMCYQLPALVEGGLTVVISPLIALMRDQV
ncbi:MAG: DEAD/DEAH box helicase, partial [Caldilineaceae bacterium]